MAGATTAERGGGRGPTGRVAGPPSPAPRARRRLPRRRILVVLLVLALLLGGFGGWALYGSDWLRVERVTVHWTEGGPHQVTEDQILAAARVPVGDPMIALDKDAVRDRLLDALPRVASVAVVRAWPHGVTLKVTERESEVVMRSAGGYTEVDGAGVPFAETDERPPGVPLLELELENSPSLSRFGADRIRREAVGVAAALPPAVRRDTHVIRVASYDSVTLELSGGRTVLWGSPEDSAAKAEALTRVMKAADDATHFDVSVVTAPAASGG
ncbi:FtsQ-type POTRA domain-containing protein [Streptomyces sp. B6B3]|uniref:cell division protein FtsQ/DivIB n=1 Tax=Streptomyces sp. B6B3 TaxID=3153570 RepID=UPI00325D3FEE